MIPACLVKKLCAGGMQKARVDDIAIVVEGIEIIDWPVPVDKPRPRSRHRLFGMRDILIKVWGLFRIPHIHPDEMVALGDWKGFRTDLAGNRAIWPIGQSGN